MLYLLCTTPCVGSNLLSRLLHETAACGRIQELFDRESMANHAPTRLGAKTSLDVRLRINEYFHAAVEEHTVDGYLGIQTDFNQLAAAESDGLALDRVVPDRLLYLTRDDLLAQSVSLARAEQVEASEPRFDPTLIVEGLRNLSRQNESWESLFESMGVQPLRVTCEALVADSAHQLERVLRYLEVDTATLDFDAVVEVAKKDATGRRDSVSDEWYREFNAFVNGGVERSAAA